MPASPALGTVTVIRLAGELSLTEVDSLLRVLTDLLLENRKQVVLNLKQVTHVSLGGISKLAEKNRRFQSLDGEIKLVGVAPYVANLFNLVGALGHFDVTSDEEEAAARFER
jgi:anti-anti-sigma factor